MDIAQFKCVKINSLSKGSFFWKYKSKYTENTQRFKHKELWLLLIYASYEAAFVLHLENLYDSYYGGKKKLNTYSTFCRETISVNNSEKSMLHKSKKLSVCP